MSYPATSVSLINISSNDNGTASQSSNQTPTPADIPVVIQNGRIDFARIITGNIEKRCYRYLIITY